MKKTISILLLILLFYNVSAQSSETVKNSETIGKNEIKTPENAVAVPDHENLYVCSTDEMGKSERSSAVGICSRKGEGWRLPTVQEMEIMYAYYLYLNLAENSYWTSDRDWDKLKFYTYNFKNGKKSLAESTAKRLVRCVWEKKEVRN